MYILRDEVHDSVFSGEGKSSRLLDKERHRGGLIEKTKLTVGVLD